MPDHIFSMPPGLYDRPQSNNESIGTIEATMSATNHGYSATFIVQKITMRTVIYSGASEMKKSVAFSVCCGLWPLFFGICLPYFSLPGGLRLVNLVWSIVEGLGLWAIDETAGLSLESRWLPLGLFAWPLIISTIMFLFGRKLARTSSRAHLVTLLALLASLIFTVSYKTANGVSFLPAYFRYFQAVW